MGMRGLAELTAAVAGGDLTPRPDGRFDVSATTQAAREWHCTVEQGCVLQDGHTGDCRGDRQTWVSAPSPENPNDESDPYRHLRGSNPCMRPWWGVVLTPSGQIVYTRPQLTKDLALAAASDRTTFGGGATIASMPVRTPAPRARGGRTLS